MRLILIATALATLAACGNEPDSAAPERGSAAGQVLGGEISDDMLPLDSVQSTSPAERRVPAPDASGPATPVDRNPGPLPSPQVSGGPDQRQSAGIEPTGEPTPE